MRRWILVSLSVLGLCLSACERGEVVDLGAEADYLNECRPYDLLLQELLGILSSEGVEELLAQTEGFGMTLPVDDELLAEIEGPVDELRLFNFEAPADLAELGEKRRRAYDAAVNAADILLDGRAAYMKLLVAYDAGETDVDARQVRVGEILDTYRTARDQLKVAEKLLPELLRSVGETP